MQINDDILKILQLALAQCFPQLFSTVDSSSPAIDISFEEPRLAQWGDLATPVCLKLSKFLRQNPMNIAEQLTAVLKPLCPSYVQEVTITNPGYINIRFDYAVLAEQIVNRVIEQGANFGHQTALQSASLHSGRTTPKVVIEHTNINPNKAAHIGHLRNACLGDTLARIFRCNGYEVEVQNYIDDTGTAVADIVVGFEVLGRQEDQRSFDYFCWDLYTEINELYEKQPQLKARQLEVLHAIEEGNNEIASTAKNIAERIVTCHLRSMARLGIFYNLLTWESHILGLGFWKHAFSTLQGKDALVHETTGPNAGCWVVRLSDHPEFAGLENPDKVLVRSNGTATYVAKDIAYQMWKFGVLGRDFGYEAYCKQNNGELLWSSELAGPEFKISREDEVSSEDGENTTLHSFGQADRVINVIDIRQRYLQDVLRVSLEQLGFSEQAKNSIHFGYEIVSLSADAAKELGVAVSLGDDKEIVAMAGRKGIGVKADDLLDRVIEKAVYEVRERHPDFDEQQCASLGHDIAVAAVRYYMQRFNMNSLIVFDFDDALNMRGNSGPYLQYAHARAHNILQKVNLGHESHITQAIKAAKPDHELTGSEKLLVRRIAEMPAVMQKAAEALAPSMVADYAYQLAATFMAFYEEAPVLSAPPQIAAFRTSLVAAYKQTLANTLEVLGIPALERM